MIYAAAVISTAISWYIGSMLDPVIGGADLGTLFPIITMGMFILYSTRSKSERK